MDPSRNNNNYYYSTNTSLRLTGEINAHASECLLSSFQISRHIDRCFSATRPRDELVNTADFFGRFASCCTSVSGLRLAYNTTTMRQERQRRFVPYCYALAPCTDQATSHPHRRQQHTRALLRPCAGWHAARLMSEQGDVIHNRPCTNCNTTRPLVPQ